MQKNSDRAEKPVKEKHSIMSGIAPKVFKKEGKQRRGKGFSRKELRESGLDSKKALRLGIPVDSRRRTLHEENVKTLKGLLGIKKVAPKPKGKSKS